MEEKNLFSEIRQFLKERFNLDKDKAEQHEVIENICRGVDFRGPNLWILIFATIVASVGLNVNSTAVIIGAMLISPLMGPIMGVGLSLGINDFELLKKSFKNFAFSVLVSLVASTLYFLISPLSIAQSELLSRTTPTIWDVLIATFGGLAGIVAQSRKDRSSTVIPGVAIATALMPPLCTAGFGVATGNLHYFVGALYLFFINVVFIAFATFFMIRFMKYERKQHLDPKRAKQVRHYMVIIITATLVPSIIMTYSIVQKSVFETQAKKFVEQVLNYENSKVIHTKLNYFSKEKSIEVTLIGENISPEAITAARTQLPTYNLDGVKLVVKQATFGDKNIEYESLEALIQGTTNTLSQREEHIKNLEEKLSVAQQETIPREEIARELGVLWPEMESIDISKTYTTDVHGQLGAQVLLCVVSLTDGSEKLSQQEQDRIESWLTERTKVENIKLTVEYLKQN
ncbi:MAG: TIGR00341 family protein, partial [Mucinivorans sp.]